MDGHTFTVSRNVLAAHSPGFIGVFQYHHCVVPLSFFAVPKETALGFSVLLHAIQPVCPDNPVGLVLFGENACLPFSIPASRIGEVTTPLLGIDTLTSK